MKNLIFFLIFAFGGLVYSQQTGTQLIYQSGNFGIAFCNSVKLNTGGIKQLYIQHGLYNYTSGINESGRYLLLNKSGGNWIIPHNGFINAGWGVYYPYPEYSCTPIPFFAISPVDTNKLIKFFVTPAAECPDAKTFYTTNGGISASMAPFACGGVLIFPTGSDYNPKSGSTLLFGYEDLYNFGVYGIYRSSNSGVNWTKITELDSLRESTGCYNWVYFKNYGFLKYNPFDTAFVYANATTSVYISTNGGYNFFRSNVNWFRDIVFSYKDSMLYGFNDYRIYRSSNKGISWDSVVILRKFNALEVNPDFPNILYGGDSLGVYRSTNYGSNWQLYNNAFSPTREVIGVSKDAGSLDTFYVVTKKNVYKVWASFIMDAKNTGGEIPSEYSLEQNYPNPFNSITNVKFQIPNVGQSSQTVTIKVFDISGKEVSTLVNEKLNPGTYEVKFDSGNLPSGIYFYRMESENFTSTKKLILLK
ncbi:MAG: T9SS type A sorting domain-containing protein [Ignavibacteria bacterium]|nr:T9SS type A sorting domain-containing protein [Ignavibacteria bacterium]